MGAKIKDLTGKKYGKLTVVKYVGIVKHRALFECVCECGNTKVIQGVLLTNGTTKSCGCLAVNNTDQTTHGLSKTHIYGIWCTMKSRCYNKNSQRYNLYGGRGITVCEEWKNNFQAFYDWAMANGYQEKLTLERMNNDGNYEPSNCRWATKKEQSNNKRNNAFITYNGKTQTLKQWADELHINYKKLWYRINEAHWNIEKALNTP